MSLEATIHLKALTDHVHKESAQTSTVPALNEAIFKSLDREVVGRLAPSRVHDFMVQICVFGDASRSAGVLDRMADVLPKERWGAWLDLANQASSTKLSYAHELHRTNPNRDCALECNPLVEVLHRRGYHSMPRQDFGLMSSILNHSDAQPEAVSKAMLTACLHGELRNPGSAITPAAREALAGSEWKQFVLQECIRLNLPVSSWAGDGLDSSLADQIERMQRSLDACAAANEALDSMSATPAQP